MHILGNKPWDFYRVNSENVCNRQGILSYASGGKDEILLGWPIKENEIVNELQREEGEGAQLEGLSSTSLLPVGGIREWLAYHTPIFQVKYVYLDNTFQYSIGCAHEY